MGDYHTARVIDIFVNSSNVLMNIHWWNKALNLYKQSFANGDFKLQNISNSSSDLLARTSSLFENQQHGENIKRWLTVFAFRLLLQVTFKEKDLPLCTRMIKTCWPWCTHTHTLQTEGMEIKMNNGKCYFNHNVQCVFKELLEDAEAVMAQCQLISSACSTAF